MTHGSDENWSIFFLDHWLEIAAGILTVSYLALVVIFRGNEAWCLLQQDGKLGTLGDFLAGALTPLALLWLIVGYFLQRREFRLQRQELKDTRRTLSVQAKAIQDQTEAETLRIMPNLSLQEEEEFKELTDRVKLFNFGGPARNMKIKIEKILPDNGVQIATLKPLPRRQLDTNESHSFRLPNNLSSPPSPDFPSQQIFYVCVSLVSERHGRFYQRCEVVRGASGFPRIKDMTEGLKPLVGEEPPRLKPPK